MQKSLIKEASINLRKRRQLQIDSRTWRHKGMRSPSQLARKERDATPEPQPQPDGHQPRRRKRMRGLRETLVMMKLRLRLRSWRRRLVRRDRS